MADAARLSRLLRPKSIAYIGGSQMAGPIRACRRAGYTGDILSVNPTRDEVGGIACHTSIADLPFAPDAAVVGLSPDRSIAAVESLARSGIGGAVVMTSGFSELGHANGRARQDALIAAAGTMPVIGPNCMGVLNLFDGAAVWGDDNLIERPEGKAAAIVSQSGAMLIGITNVEQAFPLGYAISTGNQANTDMADCIRAALEDTRVNAIGLYLEGMGDGAALGAACVEARSRGVPVVALKGGDQTAGAQAAIGHTAAMVLDRDLWEAFCERFGVVEVSSPKALVETLKLLSISGVPTGNRAAIVSYSGGVNGLAAARAGPMGLSLPQPPHPDRIRALLPETVHPTNPMDLNIPFSSSSGISMKETERVGEAITTFAGDVGDQVTFLIDVPRPGADGLDKAWCDSLAAMIDVRRHLSVPTSIAAILPEGLPVDFRRHMQRNGVAALMGLSETLEAMAAAARLSEPVDTAAEALFSGDPASVTRLLDEAESKARLKACGLTVPDAAVAVVAEAGAVSDRLGYPVAVKVLSNRIPHKARLGGVRLGLGDGCSTGEAAQAIARSVSAAKDGHPVDRVLIERMVDDPRDELILGVKRDRALGLAMMIGRGGSAAETIADFTTLLLPLTRGAIEAACAKLGYDGHVGLIAAARAVAEYAVSERDRLVSLDVNPLILTGSGDAVAADAMIVLRVE